MLVFFNDILIYNQSMETHVEHLRTIFELIKLHQLVVKESKCMFGSKQVESTSGI
jgi:hypothetical protein